MQAVCMPDQSKAAFCASTILLNCVCSSASELLLLQSCCCNLTHSDPSQVIVCKSCMQVMTQFVQTCGTRPPLKRMVWCHAAQIECDSQGYVADWAAVCMGLVTLAYAVKLAVTEYGVLKLAPLVVQQAHVHSQHRRSDRGAAHNQTPIVCYS